MPPPPPPRPKRRGRRIALISLGVVALLGGLVAVGSLDDNPAGGKDSALFDADSGFDPEARLTPEALAETDPDSIFWTMFHNQATQSVVTFNHKFYRDITEFRRDPLGWPETVHQARVDYENQRMTVGETDYDETDRTVSDQSRCVGGKQYYASNGHDDWEHDAIADAECQHLMRTDAGDGIAPGGLTGEQTDDYIHYLQTSKETNPVSTGNPELVTHHGRQYVKLPVTVTPVRYSQGYTGMTLFIWGMQDIGAHPATHLYATFGAGASGAEITYYIDPRTTLPAAMTIHETAGREPDGSRYPSDSLGFQRVEYAYPREWRPYDLRDPADVEPITLDWAPAIP